MYLCDLAVAAITTRVVGASNSQTFIASRQDVGFPAWSHLHGKIGRIFVIRFHYIRAFNTPRVLTNERNGNSLMVWIRRSHDGHIIAEVSRIF
jgi:hypothetical protein